EECLADARSERMPRSPGSGAPECPSPIPPTRSTLLEPLYQLPPGCLPNLAPAEPSVRHRPPRGRLRRCSLRSYSALIQRIDIDGILVSSLERVIDVFTFIPLSYSGASQGVNGSPRASLSGNRHSKEGGDAPRISQSTDPTASGPAPG